MSNRKNYQHHTMLNGATANGTGTSLDVRAYRHVVIALGTSGTTTATIKIQGSAKEAEPTWGSAASRTNHWDYVAHYDLNDPSAVVTGDTGVALTATDTVQNILVNTDVLTHLNLEISGYSAGTIDAEVLAGDND